MGTPGWHHISVNDLYETQAIYSLDFVVTNTGTGRFGFAQQLRLRFRGDLQFSPGAGRPLENKAESVTSMAFYPIQPGQSANIHETYSINTTQGHVILDDQGNPLWGALIWVEAELISQFIGQPTPDILATWYSAPDIRMVEVNPGKISAVGVSSLVLT